MRAKTLLLVLVAIVFLAGAASAVGNTVAKLRFPSFKKTAMDAVSNVAEVMGMGTRRDTPAIAIYGGSEGIKSAGGVIPIASTDEPSVRVAAYNVSGRADATLYKADERILLEYLAYDKDGQQVHPQPDTSKFETVTSFSFDLPTGNSQDSRISLPLTEKGIWFLRVRAGGAVTDSIIVRSTVGVLLKEGDNEFVLWGMRFSTGRSIASGKLRFYAMETAPKFLGEAAFSAEGIARITLDPQADIAVYEDGDERAVVPINLQHLNNRYRYKPFQRKVLRTKYFVFTDRPLYRPGDTVYYKSVLRDDDDGTYAIPQGEAAVKATFNWDEKSVVYDRKIQVTSDGTVYGSFELPKDASTGYYALSVTMPRPPTEGAKWYWTANTASFQVEHFRKPEYTMDVSADVTESYPGETVNFDVAAEFFSGQPVSGKSVRWAVNAGNYWEYEYALDTKATAVSDEYAWGYWGGKSVATGSAVLGADGRARVAIPVKWAETDKQAQVFSFTAEFDDGSGNPVFARKNVLVHPGDFGIYRERGTSFVRVGQPATVPIVLAKSRPTRVSGIPLTVKTVREYWVREVRPDQKYPSYRKETEVLPDQTVRTGEDGRAAVQFTPVRSGSYAVSVEGKDQRGNSVSKTFHLWVYEQDTVFSEGGDEADIQIKAEKDSYNPSDTARLTILSAVADRDVFVSFERLRMRRFRVVRMSGKTAVIDVPLERGDMPNVFVSASSFSRQAFDESSLMLPVSAEGKRLTVSVVPDRKTYGPGDTVTLTVNAKDASGVGVSADLAVWAVDKALFELTDERREKIFDRFWETRNHETSRTHSLQGIVVEMAEGGGCFAPGTTVRMANGKEKPIESIAVGDRITTLTGGYGKKQVQALVTGVHSATASGLMVINGTLRVTPDHYIFVNGGWMLAGDVQPGDRITDATGKDVPVTSVEWVAGTTAVYNLEVAREHTFIAGGYFVHNQKGDGGRSIFKDAAYWNPAVRTDASGNATIRFKLPDNLTTWLVTGIASTQDTSVGETVAELKVAKDVVVRPVVPNLLRIGDEQSLVAMVHNFTDADADFEVSLDMPDVTIGAKPKQTVHIGSKSSADVTWSIRPARESEQAKLTISAKAVKGAGSDSVTLTIPIRPFGFMEKQTDTGIGSKRYRVVLSPDADAAKSTVRLSLSASITGPLVTAMQYLIGYPYGCTEQTTSSFVPAVIAKRYADIFPVPPLTKLDDMLKKGVARLSMLQQPDGGWAWWSTGNADPFVTAYVVEYLLEARSSGVVVPQTMLDRARTYLENDRRYIVDATGGKPADWGQTDQVARVYALKLLGSPKGNVRIGGFSPSMGADIAAMAVIHNVRMGDRDGVSNGARFLAGLAKTQGDSLYWDAGMKERFGSRDAATALALRALVTAGVEKESWGKAAVFLMRQRRNEYWSNTFATAQVVRAMAEYAKGVSELSPKLSYTVTLDGKPVGSGSVTDAKQQIPDIVIPVAGLQSAGSAVGIDVQGTGQVYSTFVVGQWHTSKVAAGVAKGLEITRRYESESGAKTIGVGDTVRVRLTVAGLASDEPYAVIADELPAGLVPVNVVFKNEQFGTPNPFSDIRGDWVSQETTENGVVLTVYRLGKGEHTYTYRARAVAAGDFFAPPASVELMYSPEVSARTGVTPVSVHRKGPVFAIPGAPVAPSLSSVIPTLIRIAGAAAFAAVVIVAFAIGRKRFGRFFRRHRQ